MAWTFVPDIPYDDTAAVRVCSPLVGHCVISWGTKSPDLI
ncbi:hypothetical protein MMEU_0488 [Mycobacterium marinum str. Europe]|nr:hypothetical protein MMEU_0488 [Mycobacterium marinum str. Europe]